MTVIATASNPRFSVSRVDIDRPGPTYTIDTLRDLSKLYPDAELFFITGADALAQILTWRDVDEMFKLAQFVGCTRPGTSNSNCRWTGCRWTGSPCSRCRRWRSRRPSAGPGSPRATRPGTWCPDGIVQYIAKRELYTNR